MLIEVKRMLAVIQSKGGQSFIAFASTAKDETISRICPTLAPGGFAAVGHCSTLDEFHHAVGKQLGVNAKVPGVPAMFPVPEGRRTMCGGPFSLKAGRASSPLRPPPKMKPSALADRVNHSGGGHGQRCLKLAQPLHLSGLCLWFPTHL